MRLTTWPELPDHDELLTVCVVEDGAHTVMQGYQVPYLVHFVLQWSQGKVWLAGRKYFCLSYNN